MKAKMMRPMIATILILAKMNSASPYMETESVFKATTATIIIVIQAATLTPSAPFQNCMTTPAAAISAQRIRELEYQFCKSLSGCCYA